YNGIVFFHVRCDLDITPNRYEELQENPNAGYKCPLCEGRIKGLKEGDQKERDALAGNPVAKPVAQVAGQKLIRGIVEFKGKRVVVPEIRGWGKLAM
ncbi:8815_t:CDS:1, partial [Entrophospora sp. SA101]